MGVDSLLHPAVGKAVAPLLDSTTGLPHVALFYDRLARLIAYGRRYASQTYAVVVIGFTPSEQLSADALASLSQFIVSGIRDIDTVAYLGNGKFALLLEHLRDVSDIETVATRLQTILTLPAENPHEAATVQGCMGIALSSVSPLPTSPHVLVDNADAALASATASGQGSWDVFTAPTVRVKPTTTAVAKAAPIRATPQTLHHALTNNEFYLLYQPIVSMRDNTIAGFEALLRWRPFHNVTVEPSAFMRTAEEGGLIVPIGEWVLDTALNQMHQWQQLQLETPIFVSVNISPRQLGEAKLAERIAARLTRWDIPASSLRLEITETTLIHNLARTTQLLEQLGDMCVRICLDDFGVGYSSLGTLYKLPVHTLKVDRSFVQSMLHSKKSHEIVDTILGLANNLNLDVVAEGIETEHHYHSIKKRACAFGQGYYFASPLTAERATQLLVNNTCLP